MAESKERKSDWAVRIPAWMGGIAAVVKLAEWLLARPKLVGQVERLVIHTELPNPDSPAFFPTWLRLRVYLTNSRPHPVTVREWRLDVSRHMAHYACRAEPLPADFRDGAAAAIALDKLVDDKVVEYGKGVRGWLNFSLPDLLAGELRKGGRLTLTAVDAFGRKHKLDSPHVSKLLAADN